MGERGLRATRSSAGRGWAPRERSAGPRTGGRAAAAQSAPPERTNRILRHSGAPPRFTRGYRAATATGRGAPRTGTARTGATRAAHTAAGHAEPRSPPRAPRTFPASPPPAPRGAAPAPPSGGSRSTARTRGLLPAPPPARGASATARTGSPPGSRSPPRSPPPSPAPNACRTPAPPSPHRSAPGWTDRTDRAQPSTSPPPLRRAAAHGPPPDRPAGRGGAVPHSARPGAQNRGIAEVGKDLQGPHVRPQPTPPTPPPLPLCPLTTCPSATSPRLWKTPRDGDSPPPRAAVPLHRHSFGRELFPSIEAEIKSISLQCRDTGAVWDHTEGVTAVCCSHCCDEAKGCVLPFEDIRPPSYPVPTQPAAGLQPGDLQNHRDTEWLGWKGP